MTIQEFINTRQIEMQAIKLFARTDTEPSAWDKDASHYQVQLKIVGRGHREPLVTYFSMGSAHTHKPNAREVLDCLASDASLVENARDFGDFCAELGYDADSRSAHKSYTTICEQAARLKAFIGADDYKVLLFETERE